MQWSSKKKRNLASKQTSDGTWDGVDPALLRFLTGMKNDLMESTRETVGRIESRLNRQEASIASLDKRVEKGEHEITGQIGPKVALRVSKATVPVGGTALARSVDKTEKAYHFFRRSLKMWPVEGEQLEDAVRHFLKSKLGLSDGRI